MATVKIILRKNYQKKDGSYPITLRITKDRKARFIFTGEYIQEKDWDAKNGLAKKTYKNSKRLNNFLLKKLSEAHNIALDVETNDNQKTVKSIKKMIVNDRNTNFFNGRNVS